MPQVKDVIRVMEHLAPPRLAVDGDPVGLHTGNPETEISALLLCLDATLPALAEAREVGAGMIVAHHPRFYHRVPSSFAENHPEGARAAALIRSGLAIYSAHTNLDMTPGGTNDLLAQIAGLANPAIVKVERRERLMKLAIFVPSAHLARVREAVCQAGAGAIGAYTDCTFRCQGTGTFRCGPGTHPFQGKPGSFEEAEEYRLETVVGEYSLDQVIAAMLAAHPYEEAAYEVYPLERHAAEFGFGRVGELAGPETLGGLAARFAQAVGSRMTQYSGPPEREIRRVAVWAGGGVEVEAVIAARPDALVAGEVKFHDLETFSEQGVATITLGHGHSEEPVLEPLAGWLRRDLPGLSIHVAKNARYAWRNV